MQGQQTLQAAQPDSANTGQLYYAQRLRSNHQMAEQAEQLDDVVLLTDLADNSGRSNPHAALGRVIGFKDPDTQSQAVVKYLQGTGMVSVPARGQVLGWSRPEAGD